MDFIQGIYLQFSEAFFHEKSLWEITAVILGLAYLILAMRQNIWCWACAFFSTAIYIKLFWDFSLLMDSMLNIYYLLMAIYGFWLWSTRKAHKKTLAYTSDTQRLETTKNVSNDNKSQTPDIPTINTASNVTELPIISWKTKTHSLAIAAILLLSIISGFLLDQNTQAAWPYLDSFTTWGSVVTTYMVAKKVLENWLYWLVIDAVAMVLYIERGLYPTAILFGLYLILVIIGYFSWKQDFERQSSVIRTCKSHTLTSA